MISTCLMCQNYSGDIIPVVE